MFASTLTNTLRLIEFKMEDIMNSTTLSTLTTGNLNKNDNFYVLSMKCPIKNVNVPNVFSLTVQDVAHFLGTDSFPNVLPKEGPVPTLTKDTRH